MDEINDPLRQTDNTVSSSHLDWLLYWRLSYRKELGDADETEDNAFRLLHQPDAFVTWNEFKRLATCLAGDLDNDALLAVGQTSWKSHHFQPFRAMAQALPRIHDSYELVFGVEGIFNQLLPCNMNLNAISRHHMRLVITMQHGFIPCQELHQILCGQLSSLLQREPQTPANAASRGTMTTGHAKASITVQPTEDGAIFNIRLRLALPMTYYLQRWLAPHRVHQQTLAALTIQTDARLRGDQLTNNIHAKLTHTLHASSLIKEKYDTITRHMTEAVCVLDDCQQILFATPSIERWLGYSPKQLQSLNITQILAPSCARRLTHQLDTRHIKSIGSTVLEVELIHSDGYTLPAEIEYQRHAKKGLVLVARSLSHVRSLQNQIAEAAANYESVVRHTPEAIIQINHAFEITAVNDATQHIFGYDKQALTGKTLRLLLPSLDEGEPHVIQQPDDEHPWRTLQGCHQNGHQIPVEIHLNQKQQQSLPITTVIIRDISHRTRGDTQRLMLQQQLQAAQRMEAVGQLTSGVAHDFNNLLVAINGYTDLCLKQNINKLTRNGYLNEIRMAGKLAAELTHKLLAFSRPQNPQTGAFDVNEVIASLELMIRRLMPANITIDIDTMTEAAWVNADPGQLEQVILNLVINARDAITGVGQLQIVTRRLNIDADSKAPENLMSAGAYIQLIITDSGVGMSNDALAHLFEPFFTTKPEGVGTGLGLSVVNDIIKQNSGAIEVDSELGQGSQFSVYLPAGAADETPSTTTQPAKIIGGTETLLLVEDSQPVRDLARLILRGVGYHVIEARDGPEALSIFAAKHAEIALVIMDVVMPRMGGQQTMREMRKLAPNVRLVFTSGYGYHGLHTQFVYDQGLPFIPKPYSTDVLCDRVRTLLDA
jgi:PAS domain S-box-containing protein